MSVVPGKSDDALWDEIARIFSNGAFLQPNASWLAGISARTRPTRLQQLTASKHARRLGRAVEGAGRGQLSRLLVRALINSEQAMSAFRLTLVVNISGPVGALVLINQFLPGSVEALVRSVPPIAVYVPLAVAGSMLIGIICYAYAGTVAARDLTHLLRLRVAASGAGESVDEEPAGVVEQIGELI